MLQCPRTCVLETTEVDTPMYRQYINLEPVSKELMSSRARCARREDL